MSIHSRNTSTRSALGIISRHPIVCLPPHDVIFYATATAATAFNSVGTMPGSLVGTTVFGVPGLAVNANVQVTTGALFTSSQTITVRFTGRDQNRQPKTEDVVCVGNAAPTQNFPTLGMWTTVSDISLVATSGNLVVGPSISVGVGDGLSNGGIMAAGSLILEHPIPGLPVAGGLFAILPLNVAPVFSNLAIASHMVLGGLGVEFRNASYDVTTLAKVASVFPRHDGDVVDYAYSGVTG